MFSIQNVFVVPIKIAMQSKRMEKLISHLQETLDEDEAAKEALLLLRNAGSTQETLERPERPKCDVTALDGFGLHEDEVNSRASLFILQSIASKVIQDSTTNLCLPVKVASMQLQLPPGLLMEICFMEDPHTQWPPNFINCFQRVLEVCRLAVERGVMILSTEQQSKLSSLVDQVQRIRTEPRGAVAQFILGSIIAYADARARALPLEEPTAYTSPVATQPSPEAPLATRELYYGDLLLHTHDINARAVMLAPLVPKQRCPKHFIVPLMEPDLQHSIAVNLPPRVARLVGGGEQNRRMYRSEMDEVDGDSAVW